MRYLKLFESFDDSDTMARYQLFESNTDDIIENVKDILLPISDMGYNISVDHYTNQLIIRVVTYVDKPLLLTDEVKEEFIRMKDYLQSEGYNSIEAHYYTRFNAVPDSPSNKDVKELNEFINVKDPIVNLLFNAKKKL